MTEDQFKYVEKTIKWTVIFGLWSLVGLAVLGISRLISLVF